jgi:membrane associated rhomboid family serine protease
VNDLATAPITLTIVIATVAVTIVAFRNRSIFAALMMDINAVLGARGEWWRVATSALVHADYPHLVMNMLSLFLFGSWFEHVITSWRFGLTYLLGVIVGSFAALIVHRRDPQYLAVGASAGVCAIVGAVTVVFPDLPMMVFPIPVALPAWIVGSAYVLFSVVGTRRGFDNIGHEAHLGGTFAGVGLVAAFYPPLAIEHIMEICVMLGAGAGGYLIARRLPMRG